MNAWTDSWLHRWRVEKSILTSHGVTPCALLLFFILRDALPDFLSLSVCLSLSLWCAFRQRSFFLLLLLWAASPARLHMGSREEGGGNDKFKKLWCLPQGEHHVCNSCQTCVIVLTWCCSSVCSNLTQAHTVFALHNFDKNADITWTVMDYLAQQLQVCTGRYSYCSKTDSAGSKGTLKDTLVEESIQQNCKAFVNTSFCNL